MSKLVFDISCLAHDKQCQTVQNVLNIQNCFIYIINVAAACLYGVCACLQVQTFALIGFMMF